MIVPANASLGRPTAKLRITQSLCDLIWHACSDDGGFSGRAFFYERNYGHGRHRADRRTFCEANLFDNAPLDTRLALAHCSNTAHKGVHSGDAMKNCTALPMGITVVPDEHDCVVPATTSSPPRFSCLGTQLLADMQGVPRGSGVTTARWTALPNGTNIKPGGFFDGQVSKRASK